MSHIIAYAPCDLHRGRTHAVWSSCAVEWIHAVHALQVLSVVAQHLASIQGALRAHNATVMLSSREVPLSPCGVFVTMNPGYAGRIGLPDNLQALFRPMTLMAPDSTTVAEVVLFW
jgi:hypothetical protein